MSTIRAANIGAPTGNTQSVSNILSGVAKGWCYFNVSTGIIGSFGISSYTRTGTGSATFVTSLTFSSTSNMSIVASGHYGGVTWCPSPYSQGVSTTSFNFQIANSGGAGTDANVCHVLLSGILA